MKGLPTGWFQTHPQAVLPWVWCPFAVSDIQNKEIYKENLHLPQKDDRGAEIKHIALNSPTFFHCPVPHQRGPAPFRPSFLSWTGISTVRMKIAFYIPSQVIRRQELGRLGSSRALFTSSGQQPLLKLLSTYCSQRVWEWTSDCPFLLSSLLFNLSNFPLKALHPTPWKPWHQKSCKINHMNWWDVSICHP